jgi:hypothetical protein
MEPENEDPSNLEERKKPHAFLSILDAVLPE